jgi:hypothetical protein
MMRFVEKLLPGLVKEARPRFKMFREAHRAYGKGAIAYREWLKEISAGSKRWKGAVAEEAKAEEGAE